MYYANAYYDDIDDLKAIYNNDVILCNNIIHFPVIYLIYSATI